MTNEEVLNIVKLKYPEAKLSEDGRIIMENLGTMKKQMENR